MAIIILPTVGFELYLASPLPQPGFITFPSSSASEIILMVLELIVLLGLYGFCFKVRIINTAAWKSVLVAYILTAIFVIYDSPMFFMELRSEELLISIIVLLFFISPKIYALVIYSYKSPELWVNTV